MNGLKEQLAARVTELDEQITQARKLPMASIVTLLEARQAELTDQLTEWAGKENNMDAREQAAVQAVKQVIVEHVAEVTEWVRKGEELTKAEAQWRVTTLLRTLENLSRTEEGDERIA